MLTKLVQWIETVYQRDGIKAALVVVAAAVAVGLLYVLALGADRFSILLGF